MKSEFNMGTGPRKAIYIPFPQAIPNKASIDKREVEAVPRGLYRRLPGAYERAGLP